ncbi:MAG: response regulator [Oscillospiraceae bacterium]|nr:response regulator [Oscillospiraceae bacterium]
MKKLKIFFVDDLKVNLHVMNEALSEQYAVFTMLSVPTLFRTLEKVIPDLILLDTEMLNMCGFDAIKLLKSNEKYKNIPIILYSGDTEPETLSRGFELGAVDYIIKPSSKYTILKHVNECLKAS